MDALTTEKASFRSSLVSIVVPARNEEAVIGELLGALLRQDFRGALRVIVVANGCSDNTASRAQDWVRPFADSGHSLEVLVLQDGGKCAAINAAEARLPESVRLYVDADVLPDPTVVRLVDELLSGGEIHLCAPEIRVAPARSPWSRSYFRAWLSTRAVREDVVGAGMLAVSAAGRRRWNEFPPIVADDYFVRSHFSETERRIVSNASFCIRPAEGLREVISTRSRWMRGEAESGLPKQHSKEKGWRSLLRDRSTRKDAPIYLMTVGCAAVLARLRRGRGVSRWERSERSRETVL